MIEKPKPEKLFAFGTQPRRLYETLATCGEVSNYQIVRDLRILAYGGVINKVRKALEPYKIDVAIRRYGNGVFTYRLAINKEELCRKSLECSIVEWPQSNVTAVRSMSE
jgi:hypothetical protein